MNAGGHTLTRLITAAVVLAAVLAGFIATQSAAAAAPPADWRLSGPVSAVARAGDRIILGGSFDYIGPVTGPGAAVSTSTGELVGEFPLVEGGDVDVVIGDGAGGFYIGGDFTTVGGLPRSGLAHLLEDGRLDQAWEASVDGDVYALALGAGRVYAGGDFAKANGNARANLAAFDASTGALAAWNPSPSGDVYALAFTAATVFAGGDFTRIAGAARDRIAGLDAVTGALVPTWDSGADDFVAALLVSGDTLFVGGEFSTMNDEPRARLAALDLTSGRLKPWNPQAVDTVWTLAEAGSTILAGGSFWSIDDQERNNVASLDRSSGAVTSWNPSADGIVDSIVVSGSTAFLGGYFDAVGGAARSGLAAVDLGSGRATAWNPGTASFEEYGDEQVYSLALAGSTLYAGGAFSSAGGLKLGGLAAVDATTHAWADWSVGTTGEYSGVNELLVSDGTLYVGGYFEEIGGKPRANLAAVNLATGGVLSWNPAVLGEVSSLARRGSTIYLGGDSSGSGGSPVAA